MLITCDEDMFQEGYYKMMVTKKYKNGTIEILIKKLDERDDEYYYYDWREDNNYIYDNGTQSGNFFQDLIDEHRERNDWFYNALHGIFENALHVGCESLSK